MTYSSSKHVKHKSTKAPPVDCFAMSTSHQDLRCPETSQMQSIIHYILNVGVCSKADKIA